MIKPKSDPHALRASGLSDAASLRFTYEEPTSMTPYTYVLEGTHYGAKFSIHMNRSGAKELAKKLLDALL